MSLKNVRLRLFVVAPLARCAFTTHPFELPPFVLREHTRFLKELLKVLLSTDNDLASRCRAATAR